jgi:hypothetical protein
MNVMAGFAAVSLTALFLCIALGAFAYSFSFSHLTRAPHEMSTLLSSTFATTSTIILHLFFFLCLWGFRNSLHMASQKHTHH